jgi:hypothetical protein
MAGDKKARQWLQLGAYCPEPLVPQLGLTAAPPSAVGLYFANSDCAVLLHDFLRSEECIIETAMR